MIETDPQYGPQKTSLTLSSDAKFNKQQIAKFSIKDAENYEKYEDWLNQIVSVLEGL